MSKQSYEVRFEETTRIWKKVSVLAEGESEATLLVNEGEYDEEAVEIENDESISLVINKVEKL